MMKFFIYIDILGFVDLPKEFANKMYITEYSFRKNLLESLQKKIKRIEKSEQITTMLLKDDFLLIAENDVQKVLRIVSEVTRVPLPMCKGYIPLEVVIGRKEIYGGIDISRTEVCEFLKESKSTLKSYRKEYKKRHNGESPKQTFIILSSELFGSELNMEIVTPSIFVADAETIFSWKWDEKKLFDKLMDFRMETINDIIVGVKGQTVQLMHTFMKHPDTWRLLVDKDNNIVGFWHFLPLSKPAFEKCKAGQLVDDEIEDKLIQPLGEPGWYDIYIVSVCVKSQFRQIPGSFCFFNSQFNVFQELPHKCGSHFLFDSLFKVFTKLAHKKIFIREVCANAFTKSGIETCERFGLRYLRQHKTYGRIYGESFLSILEHLKKHPELSYLLKSNPELTELYSQHKKENIV